MFPIRFAAKIRRAVQALRGACNRFANMVASRTPAVVAAPPPPSILARTFAALAGRGLRGLTLAVALAGGTALLGHDDAGHQDGGPAAVVRHFAVPAAFAHDTGEHAGQNCSGGQSWRAGPARHCIANQAVNFVEWCYRKSAQYGFNKARYAAGHKYGSATSGSGSRHWCLPDTNPPESWCRPFKSDGYAAPGLSGWPYGLYCYFRTGDTDNRSTCRDGQDSYSVELHSCSSREPTLPRNLRIVAAEHPDNQRAAFRISWSAPADDGGDDITKSGDKHWRVERQRPGDAGSVVTVDGAKAANRGGLAGRPVFDRGDFHHDPLAFGLGGGPGANGCIGW